jgi:hypothetical protein
MSLPRAEIQKDSPIDRLILRIRPYQLHRSTGPCGHIPFARTHLSLLFAKWHHANSCAALLAAALFIGLPEQYSLPGHRMKRRATLLRSIPHHALREYRPCVTFQRKSIERQTAPISTNNAPAHRQRRYQVVFRLKYEDSLAIKASGGGELFRN